MKAKSFSGGREAPYTHAAPYTKRTIGATVTRTPHEIASHQVRGGQGPGVPKKPPRGDETPGFPGAVHPHEKHLLAQNASGRRRGG